MGKPLPDSYGSKINLILKIAVKLLETKFIKDKELKSLLEQAKKGE